MDAKHTHDIALVVDALSARTDTLVDHDTLTAVVEADFRRYDSARIRDFVPVLVERDVRERLVRRRARSRAARKRSSSPHAVARAQRAQPRSRI
jgi:hypothetical protein